MSTVWPATNPPALTMVTPLTVTVPRPSGASMLNVPVWVSAAALGELPSLRSSSSTTSSAPGAVEPGDHHRIVAAVEGHGEGRRIAVAVAVGQRVVERVGQRRARRQRVDRRLARGRQRVGLGAVGVERDRAVGAGQVGEGAGQRAVGAGVVVGIDIDGHRDRTALGQARDIVVGHRRIVDDLDVEAGGVGRAVGVLEDDGEALGQAAVVGTGVEQRVVLQHIAVVDRAADDGRAVGREHRREPGDAEQAGRRCRPSGRQRTRRR